MIEIKRPLTAVLTVAMLALVACNPPPRGEPVAFSPGRWESEDGRFFIEALPPDSEGIRVANFVLPLDQEDLIYSPCTLDPEPHQWWVGESQWTPSETRFRLSFDMRSIGLVIAGENDFQWIEIYPCSIGHGTIYLFRVPDSGPSETSTS